VRARYVTADVFTDKAFGGNPLAVFPDATQIPEAHLLSIAREFNYSETTFVFPPSDARHARRFRIFTPAGEIPFAGHPTLGAAHVLATLGDIPLTGETTRVVVEEGVGPIRVLIEAVDGVPVFEQLSAAKLPARRDSRTDGTLRWRVEQGFEMGRPSLLDVEVDKRAGAIVDVRVGGQTVVVCDGMMEA
jgi:PhzF family phenazine biosynthesis protein